MVRMFFGQMYGSNPVEFCSAYGLDESVQRLADATSHSTFSTLVDQAAVGTVTTEKVSLFRHVPWFANSFKPVFKGRFELRDGRVFLVGKFTMMLSVKLFMSIWFGFQAFFIASAATSAFASGKESDWSLLLVGVGMLAFGVVAVVGGKGFSREDRAWIVSVIEKALSAAPSNHSLKADVPDGTRL